VISGADAGYVDPSACAPCHSRIWESYKKTGMGRSFSATTAAIQAGSGTYYHKASDRYYTVTARDGKLYQRRHQTGFGDKETNIVEKTMDYAVGSGNHSRTYLNRGTDGKLRELPLSWYADKGGYWAMSPGYDGPRQEDFRREINYQCMFCHNGYPSVRPGDDASGTAPVFRGTLPEGIDCQRCHGPGRAHVTAMQSSGASKANAAATIVNPAKLSSERQLELCMQCHLETTSFPLPGAIIRYNRGVFSYRPGEPLSDYILYFDRAQFAGHEDDFEIAHAAYRLRKSACFRESGGAMVCTTCHDPHDIPRGEAAVKHYTETCLSCHSAGVQKMTTARRHPASQDCIGCHMPKRRTDDVVHVIMTDHFIQRRKPAGELLAPVAERTGPEKAGYKGEVAPYYPAKLPGGAESELYLAVAQVRQGANLQGGIPMLESALTRYRPKDAEFYFELAEAYRKDGQAERAAGMYREALGRKPDLWAAVHGLATTLDKLGRVQEAAELLQDAVSKAPGDASLKNDLGLVYIGMHHVREAVEALRAAVLLDPDLPDAYNNLGGALSDSGDQPRAEEAYRSAIRVQPDMPEAHKNLANLLAPARFDEAQYHYRKAIAIEPAYAAAYLDYGSALARHERFSQAKEQFQAALRADPRMAEAQNALGEMLAIEGDNRSAIECFERAVAIKPEFPTAQSNLGTALLMRGQAANAKPHLEAAVRLNADSFDAHLYLGKILLGEHDVTGAAAHFRKAMESQDAEIRNQAEESLAAIGRP
jgi:predicted CXXCH cytochrome family protein